MHSLSWCGCLLTTAWSCICQALKEEPGFVQVACLHPSGTQVFSSRVCLRLSWPVHAKTQLNANQASKVTAKVTSKTLA